MSSFISLCLITLTLSYLCVGLVRQYLNQHLIDIPNERSSHKVPTPRGGGLGFIAGAAIGLLLYSIFPGQSTVTVPVSLWLSLLPLIVIGLLDDWKNLKASTRYGVQLFVSSLLVWQLGAFPQPWLSSLGWFGDLAAVCLTVIGVTALINFYNFMDGLDGLVAGVSLLQFSFCAVVFNQPFLWVVVAALLGFLVWNWAPAKIFMGDVGSTTLGATMAMTLLYNSRQEMLDRPGFAWSCLVILLPLIGDSIYTLFRRSLRRENIFQAHRSHVYQRLSQIGWSHAQVVILYISATALVSISLIAWGNIGALSSCIAGFSSLFAIEWYLPQINLENISKVVNTSPLVARPRVDSGSL